MSEIREAVSKRVRALLQKTTENGATEAEAVAAAEKARELLEHYRFSAVSGAELMKLPIYDSCMFYIADAACRHYAADADTTEYSVWVEIYSHLWYVNELLGGEL